MGVDAALPPGLWERVAQIARDELGKLLRSGLLRNASISDGGLTIKGGFLKLLDKISGTTLFYVGPVNPSRADGADQQGWYVYRADGTIVLLLRDANPTDAGGALNQALTWFDRTGNVVFSDDTDSGLGIGRPYLPGVFYESRFGDFPASTAGSYETVWRARIPKQHPRLYVEAWTGTDTAGTIGQVQVLVNGTVWGAAQTATNSVVALQSWGPVPVAGNFGDTLTVEIQVQRTAGTGLVRVGAAWAQGMQS